MSAQWIFDTLNPKKFSCSKHFKSRFIFHRLPLLLSFLFALIWYYPSSKNLVGWGEDPYFNLWTLEEVWKHLSKLGVWNLFSNEFWKTPIFSPFPDTLAFSENQVFTGLLSWPIRFISQNGIFTYNLTALLMSLTTFYFTWKWLSLIGIKKYELWGGLIFQGCGWIQDHYAHFQNICIFVFPMALYSWSFLNQKPRYGRALFCAFCFGWVIGWNVYYQVFLNFIFTILLIKAALRNELPKTLLAVLGAATLLIELPIAYRYLELESLMGSLRVPSGEYVFYSASPLSFLAHWDATSFLQNFLPFYPKIKLSIENVGFLGITWCVLALCALRNSRARIFTLIALFFFWIALGPHFGLMTLLKLFPGFHATRAIGRIQILVALFSLASVLLYLETLKPRIQIVLLSLILLELLPGGVSKAVPVAAGFYDKAKTELEVELARIPQNQPLLILPEVKSKFQLLLSRADNSLLEGYSGRTPLNAHLLNQLSKSGITNENLKEKLFFSKTNYVISTENSLTETLKSYPYVKLKGCYSHFGFNPCLFLPKWTLQEDQKCLNQPLFHLDQDTHWEYPQMDKGHKAILKADRSGILAYEATGKCWVEESIYLGKIKIWKSKRALLSHGFLGVEFKTGDTILEQESKQGIYSLPRAIRPQKIYDLVCRST
jgi:hypothetical protein